MPIRKYISDNRSFDPEQLDALNQAFTAALAKLGLNDRSDPMGEIVARRVITAALASERNPITLTEIGAGGASRRHSSKKLARVEAERVRVWAGQLKVCLEGKQPLSATIATCLCTRNLPKSTENLTTNEDLLGLVRNEGLTLHRC
jgi:hypothetical protein